MAEEITLGAAAAAGSGGTGMTSLNGNTAAAQTIAAGTGLAISNVGAVHTLSATGTSLETLLGSALNKDMQAAATYNLFVVPGGKSAALTRVVAVLVSGDPSVTGDGSFILTSAATTGTLDFATIQTTQFSPATLNQVAMFVAGDVNNNPPTPLYAAADTFQIVSAGGTDACTFNFYAFGILI